MKTVKIPEWVSKIAVAVAVPLITSLLAYFAMNVQAKTLKEVETNYPTKTYVEGELKATSSKIEKNSQEIITVKTRIDSQNEDIQEQKKLLYGIQVSINHLVETVRESQKDIKEINKNTRRD